MLDVSRWLAEQGLGYHAEAFARNGIAGDVLRDLTDADLKELGLNLGDRKRLLKAIAALNAPAAPDRLEGADATTSIVAREAERRQLTVMFVDLVGSTELAARLDPEDMSALIRGYQNAVAGEITRFEGHIAKYMGDGVLAYFGWPRAHEDEAERAVRAGLAVIQAVGDLREPGGERLVVRIGIATGPVVVGELIGEGAAQEQAVVGETPNLAARLQALAAPGAVLIGATTRRLLGGLFECADLGVHHVKGFAAPVGAWQVLGAGQAEGRFDARQLAGVTPLVGREHELGLLLDRWQQAKEGDGQVVLLAGEAGVGKSRLVRALRERLSGDPFMPVSHFCSPYHQNSVLHPVIGLLERVAGLAREDPPERQLDKIESLLARATDDVRAVAPLFADLLSIPTGDRYPPLALSPQRQKELTLKALVDQLAGLAARQPVLALYEDVHWSDPTTLELLDRAIDGIEALPVLGLITFRPEFTPPWIGHAHVTLMTLNRLSRRLVAIMVERVTGGKPLPGEVTEQIIARTDGVPLFVEELTKVVLESGLLRETDKAYVLDGPLPPLAIPATLYDSLMARLDRLSSVKEVAQIGAVIGREFSYELLAGAVPLDEGRLQDALRQLTEAELVFRRGIPPHATYTFKHALVQEAAYQSMLKGRRQQLHARIAAVLEERLPETVEAEPDLLAHHWTEAGLAKKAVQYWLRAGELAIRRSATTEALAHLDKGLDLLKNLPEGPERCRLELKLQVALGVTLMAAKGWAAPEVGRVNARARELCEQVGDARDLFPVLYGQWVFHVVRAQLDVGREAGEELLRLAQRHRDVGAEVAGHRIVGTALLILGELVPARGHLEQALALYDPGRHRALAFLYAQDPRVAALAGLSWVLLVLGYPEQALARSREGITYARELAHRNTVGYALLYGSILCQLCGQWEGARERAEALTSLATEEGFPHFLGTATIVRASAATEERLMEAEVEQLQQGLAAWRATGAGFLVPYFLALLAQAHAKVGRSAAALDLLTEALVRVEETKERWYEAELHRLRGELLLVLPAQDYAEAEASLGRALAVAVERNAKLWELRAATSLARLWAANGERQKAHGLLAPVYGWFTEGFDTPDLVAAKAMLDELV